MICVEGNHRHRKVGHCLAMMLLSTIMVAPAAHAEQHPRGSAFDGRVQLVDYNPLNVVRIVCGPTSSTQIQFATAERIVYVAIGDADSWLAQPQGNLLFIKPVTVKDPTNMQVVTTNNAGELRSYQMSIVAEKPDAAVVPRVAFTVIFQYPQDEARIAAIKAELNVTKDVIAKAQATQQLVQKATDDRLAGAWKDGPRNWRYVAQGDRQIEPTEVSDNTRQTAFRFPGNMRIPTIYAIAPDGSETIVPYTMIDDMAVVQTTAKAFVLRDGQEVLKIINQGFDPVGINAGTGTGTSDLERVVTAPTATAPAASVQQTGAAK